MNGGARLTVEGRRVDLHYRDLDDVERRRREAEHGGFSKELLMFYLAGVPSYLPVAELALNLVLRGSLPRPEFPPALCESASCRWHADALLSLGYAEAATDDVIRSGNLALAHSPVCTRFGRYERC